MTFARVDSRKRESQSSVRVVLGIHLHQAGLAGSVDTERSWFVLGEWLRCLGRRRLRFMAREVGGWPSHNPDRENRMRNRMYCSSLGL